MLTHSAPVINDVMEAVTLPQGMLTHSLRGHALIGAKQNR